MRSALTKLWLTLCIDIAICLLCAVGSSLGVVYGARWIGAVPAGTESLTELGIWAVCAVLIIQNGLVVGFLRWRSASDWRLLLGAPQDIRSVVLASVIALPMVLAGNLVVGVIAALAGKTHNQIALLPFEAGDTAGQVAFLLVAAVIVPCAEEILFRGYVYGRLEDLVRPTIAVVLSAALFAGAHTWSASTGSITLVLQTFAMGLVLGWVRQHSNSIFPSMIAHAGNNAFALTLVLSCVNHPELGCART